MRKLLAINAVLLFAVTITFMIPFYGICTKGTHTIYEPKTFILALEVSVFILILMVALFSMLHVIIYRKNH